MQLFYWNGLEPTVYSNVKITNVEIIKNIHFLCFEENIIIVDSSRVPWTDDLYNLYELDLSRVQ